MNIFKALGYVLLYWSPLAFIYGPIHRAMERKRREQHRDELVQLRSEKLRRDIQIAEQRRLKLVEDTRTQNERTALVANQSVLTELKIDEKRRDLGIVEEPWTPTGYYH